MKNGAARTVTGVNFFCNYFIFNTNKGLQSFILGRHSPLSSQVWVFMVLPLVPKSFIYLPWNQKTINKKGSIKYNEKLFRVHFLKIMITLIYMLYQHPELRHPDNN